MRRQLSGVLFVALAGVLAWGQTVDPDKAVLRWPIAVAMAAWGVYSLMLKRDRIDHVYAQILAMGVAVAAVGWLIPGSGSRGLLAVGGLLVLAALGLLLWSWYQRRRASDDDTNRPR
jgi:hypothetical protein